MSLQTCGKNSHFRNARQFREISRQKCFVLTLLFFDVQYISVPRTKVAYCSIHGSVQKILGETVAKSPPFPSQAPYIDLVNLRMNINIYIHIHIYVYSYVRYKNIPPQSPAVLGSSMCDLYKHNFQIIKRKNCE